MSVHVSNGPRWTARRVPAGLSKKLTFWGASTPQSVIGNQMLAERLGKRLGLSGEREHEELADESLLQLPREFLIDHRVHEALGYEPILVPSPHAPRVFVLGPAAASFLQKVLDRVFGLPLAEEFGFGPRGRSGASVDVRKVYFRYGKLDAHTLAGFAPSVLPGFRDPLTGKPGAAGIIYLNVDAWRDLNLAEQLAVIGHEFVHALQFAEAPMRADLMARFDDEVKRFTLTQRYGLRPEARTSLQGRDPLDKNQPLELTAQLVAYAIMVENLGLEPVDLDRLNRL
jgi:hypothetical protein